MIAAVELGTDFLGVRGVAGRGVEIHHGIECLAVADPLIDGRAGLFALLGVIICASKGVMVQPITRMPWVWARSIICRNPEITSSAFAPRPMSLMPSRTVNHFTPATLMASRSKRPRAFVPTPSTNTRLPAIPSFARPTFAVPCWRPDVARVYTASCGPSRAWNARRRLWNRRR